MNTMSPKVLREIYDEFAEDDTHANEVMNTYEMLASNLFFTKKLFFHSLLFVDSLVSSGSANAMTVVIDLMEENKLEYHQILTAGMSITNTNFLAPVVAPRLMVY